LILNYDNQVKNDFKILKNKKIRNELISSTISAGTRKEFIEILISHLPESKISRPGSDQTQKRGSANGSIVLMKLKALCS
jgi:hypothetical protein